MRVPTENAWEVHFGLELFNIAADQTYQDKFAVISLRGLRGDAGVQNGPNCLLG